MHGDWMGRVFGLLFLFLAGAVQAGPAIENWTSERGGRVYFVHADGLPLVDIRVVFDAGSARDGEQFGVASLTAGLLDSGAGTWSADDIARRLEGVGARLSTGASLDSAWLALRSLTRKDILEQALDTVATVIGSARFGQTDFDREKGRVLAALQMRDESPGDLASEAFYAAVYGEHPYAHPSEGTRKTVKALTRDDVVAFYERYYVAANATVVVVGDVTRAQAEAIADQLLAGLDAGSVPDPIPVAPETPAAAEKRIEFPSEQTHIFSGMSVLTREDPDYVPLYVGNHILGGSGLVSRVSEEVREKRGLSYSAYSYFLPLRRKGPFTMGLQTRNDQADEALKVLRNTVAEFIEKGPTDEELVAAKKNITGGFVLRYDTNQKLTEYVAMIAFYGLPLDYLDTFPERVEAVTREQIVDAFKRRVDPAKFQTALVGGGTK